MKNKYTFIINLPLNLEGAVCHEYLINVLSGKEKELKYQILNENLKLIQPDLVAKTKIETIATDTSFFDKEVSLFFIAESTQLASDEWSGTSFSLNQNLLNRFKNISATYRSLIKKFDDYGGHLELLVCGMAAKTMGIKDELFAEFKLSGYMNLLQLIHEASQNFDNHELIELTQLNSIRLSKDYDIDRVTKSIEDKEVLCSKLIKDNNEWGSSLPLGCALQYFKNIFAGANLNLGTSVNPTFTKKYDFVVFLGRDPWADYNVVTISHHKNDSKDVFDNKKSCLADGQSFTDAEDSCLVNQKQINFRELTIELGLELALNASDLEINVALIFNLDVSRLSKTLIKKLKQLKLFEVDAYVLKPFDKANVFGGELDFVHKTCFEELYFMTEQKSLLIIS